MKLNQSMSCFAIVLSAVYCGLAQADVAGNAEKIGGKVVVYENDDTGATVRGSISRLIAAVRSGGDIKVGLNDGSIWQKCTTVRIYNDVLGGQQVACEFVAVELVLDSQSLAEPRLGPRINATWTDTERRRATASAFYYDGQARLNGSNVIDTVNGRMTWIAHVR